MTVRSAHLASHCANRCLGVLSCPGMGVPGAGILYTGMSTSLLADADFVDEGFDGGFALDPGAFRGQELGEVAAQVGEGGWGRGYGRRRLAWPGSAR